MNRKKVLKSFYFPTQGYFAAILAFLVVIMSVNVPEKYQTLLSGIVLAIGFVPLIIYKNTKRNLKPYGSPYVYYGYEATLFILPVLLYFAANQIKVIEIIAIVFYVITYMYARVMAKIFTLSEERITSIIPEVKKNQKIKISIASIFAVTFILLNVWFGYIKPTFIDSDVVLYEYLTIFLVLIIVLVLEYKKVMTVPNKNGYYVSLILLVLYLAVPQLYTEGFKAFVSYAVIYLVGYVSLYIFGFEDYPFVLR